MKHGHHVDGRPSGVWSFVLSFLHSLVGAATSVIFVTCITSFVTTEVCLSRQTFCCDTCVCHNKTHLLSWQKYDCRDKKYIATNRCLSWQTFCHDKNMLACILSLRQQMCFVTTKMILVAAPASDILQSPIPSRRYKNTSDHSCSINQCPLCVTTNIHLYIMGGKKITWMHQIACSPCSSVNYGKTKSKTTQYALKKKTCELKLENFNAQG